MQDIPAVEGKYVSLVHNHSSLNQICTRRVCVKRTSAGLSVAFSRMLRAPRRKVAKCSKCDLARAQRFFARNLGAPLIDEQTEAVSTTGQESVSATQRALQVSHALAHASSLCWGSKGKRRGVDSWPEFYLFIFIFEGGEEGGWGDLVKMRNRNTSRYRATATIDIYKVCCIWLQSTCDECRCRPRICVRHCAPLSPCIAHDCVWCVSR